jgi:hypothetical protein
MKLNILFESRWKRPSWSDEYGEFERVGDEMKIDVGMLKGAFDQGRLIPLTDDIWSILDNTDSWAIQSMEEVLKYSATYGRDIKRIIIGLQSNVDMPAPIVLKFSGNQYTLVGGNTRLMAAKALNIRPYVWLMEV